MISRWLYKVFGLESHNDLRIFEAPFPVNVRNRAMLLKVGKEGNYLCPSKAGTIGASRGATQPTNSFICSAVAVIESTFLTKCQKPFTSFASLFFSNSG